MSRSRMSVNLDLLLQLRLAIARIGEMDGAGWWNTRGVLGATGSFVFRRTFPQTYLFAQARVAFAVARSRCQEVFAPPGCATLWNLPAEIEDSFEDQWHVWLDQADEWQPFFSRLDGLRGHTVVESLMQLELLSVEDEAALKRLSVSPEGRSVLLPATSAIDDASLRQLAGAFDLARPGSLVIPYIPML